VKDQEFVAADIMPRPDVCIELMSLITGFVSLPSGRSDRNAIGVVQEVAGGKIIMIEGNTNVDASPEGIGVFRRESRKIAQINKGFIDYSAA
jgi:hypothetical protein